MSPLLESKSSDEFRLASLYIVLKDHNNRSLVELQTTSQCSIIRNEAMKENIHLDAVVLKEGERYSSEFLSVLWMTERMDLKVANELRKGFEIIKSQISIKLIDQVSASEFLQSNISYLMKIIVTK